MAFLQYISNDNFRNSVAVIKTSPRFTAKEISYYNSKSVDQELRSTSEKTLFQIKDFDLENGPNKSFKLSVIEPEKN